MDSQLAKHCSDLNDTVVSFYNQGKKSVQRRGSDHINGLLKWFKEEPVPRVRKSTCKSGEEVVADQNNWPWHSMSPCLISIH
jgi:hypothetical protein